MTSSPPPDAQYFRGKTLTPESPVPLHIPEPSHIPVLQNQIEPIFNLLSTHISQSLNSNLSMDTEHFSVQNELDRATQPNTDIAHLINGVNEHAGASNRHEPDQGDRDYVQAFDDEDSPEEEEEHEKKPNTIPNHSSTSAAQLSSSIPAYESLIPHPPDPPLSSALNHTRETVPDLFQPSPAFPQPSQDATVHEDPVLNAQPGSPDDSDDQMQDGGVNYQTLLDNLSPSTATAPSAENITSITTAAPPTATNVSRPSSAESPISTLPLPPGLPPRPPPQEKPAIHPNYTTEEDIRSYHYPHVQSTTTPNSSATQSNNPIKPIQALSHPLPPTVIVGSNGLPPPPLATFQQPPPQTAKLPQSGPVTSQSQQPEDSVKLADRDSIAVESHQNEPPWPQQLEKLYSDFLNEEAVYVAEGVWDRFPSGSRLFVGNLYSEKVTKRDLFFVFQRYGRLAQISIKNAYGFIQFYEASCSNRAIQGEQGSAIRGRKIHLEVSKPQKNSRNAAATTAGNNLRAGHGRRSRSPDYDRGSRGTGGRPSIDRGVIHGSVGSDVRRRDDYRPMRSPSPRGFRGRDEYRGRERSPDRYYGSRRSRSRSPFGRNGRYRSRSPRGRDMDDEANLSMPRRHPRDVPEVQMILVDEVDRTFVAYIEKTFRDRGLTCSTFQLPRVSLVAVIKRQILEGVQAVVKILRQSQVTGKIPLQVFDHSAGVDNVRYEEYNELDAHIAAELVVRAKASRLAPPAVQQPSNSSYGIPQFRPPQPIPQQPMPPQQPQPSPNIANLITSLDGPALQKLLGAMAQNPQSPQTPQQGQPPPQFSNLSSFLGGNPQQQQAPQGYPQFSQGGSLQQNHQPPPSPYGPAPNGQSLANNPALASLLANVGANRPALQQPGMHQGQPEQQQHVQNIMEQLSRWKQ
ncbi:nuclear polyadenylated RNA-binding protein 3 [Xanthoria parietina]